MRRYVFIFLFVAVLLTPFVMRRVLLRGAGARTVADRNAARLVIVTPHNQDIRREFARAFSAWHLRRYGQAVELDFRVPGATNDIRRLLDTTYRSYLDSAGRLPDDFVPDIQVIWGGGDFFFNELKGFSHGSVLQPLGLTQEQLDDVFPQKSLAGVALYDQAADAAGRPLPPQWVGVCLSAFGIVYNPSLYREMGLPAPERWRDLTRPELAGSLALADPSHSGSAAVAYMMVVQRAMADAEEQFARDHPDVPKAAWSTDAQYKSAIARGWKRGMADLLLIAANARYWTPWASQVPTDVVHGDAAAGVAIDFYALVTEGIVGSDRARFVSPADATAVTPDPVAILAGVKGEKLALARHFVEFLLTREAQLLWVLKPGTPGGPRERLLGRPPIRRDVYERTPDWSDAPNPFEQSHTFNQRPDWMALFAENRLVWSAAWIDGRDALRSAYGTILDVPDPQERSALLAELANLPLELTDLEQMRAARKQVEAQKGDVEGWRARMRIEWAERFRQHYRDVASRAKP
jgi:ABC-type Fe3+ transport system substrate-binding protein